MVWSKPSHHRRCPYNLRRRLGMQLGLIKDNGPEEAVQGDVKANDILHSWQVLKPALHASGSRLDEHDQQTRIMGADRQL
jgi:hypothetical protein